jgi:hypothetical protein
MLAAQYRKLFEPDANARKRAGVKVDLPVNCGEGRKGRESSAKAGEMFNVSAASVER